MWDRVLLKEKGKKAFQSNYWRCVLAAFILMLLVGGNSASARPEVSDVYNQSSGITIDNFTSQHFTPTTNPVVSRVQGMVLGWFDAVSLISPVRALFGSVVALIFMFIILILNIFVFSPLEVGGCRFFIENSYEPSFPERLLYPFQCGHYGKIVTAMFLRELYIFGWSLLLLIPGIVKRYEYRMVPYLMAECPEMGESEAFRISRELMYGQKLNAFILDLSFIGWGLLSAITLGIVGIFYASPYQHATNAELFLELKRQYFSHSQEHGGTKYP